MSLGLDSHPKDRRMGQPKSNSTEPEPGTRRHRPQPSRAYRVRFPLLRGDKRTTWVSPLEHDSSTGGPSIDADPDDAWRLRLGPGLAKTAHQSFGRLLVQPPWSVDIRGFPVGLFSCFGQTWRFTGNDAQVIDLLHTLYSPLQLPGLAGAAVVEYRLDLRATGRGGHLFRDGEPLGEGLSPARLLRTLVWAINRQVIDGAVQQHLLLHASAAADAAGQVVLLPAPMESGKTTLVTGLLDRRLHYLTDEAAIVEPNLTVRGFAKPLSIDRGAWELFDHHAPELPPSLAPYMAQQWQVPAQRITEVAESGRLALIVFPSYCPGTPTRLTRLRTVDALNHARGSTFAPDDRPLSATRIAELAAIVTGVPCYSLRSGDLEGSCTAVLSALDEHTST